MSRSSGPAVVESSAGKNLVSCRVGRNACCAIHIWRFMNMGGTSARDAAHYWRDELGELL